MLTQPKVRVLIVDDSSSDRIIAHAMLTKLKTAKLPNLKWSRQRKLATHFT
jgi:hypothetical protein